MNEADEAHNFHAAESSIKQYIPPGFLINTNLLESDASSDNFDPFSQNANRRLLSKLPEIQKKIPKKFDSLMSNKLLDNKYKYIKEKAAKSGSFMDEEQANVYKGSIDGSRSGVLSASIKKISRIKESTKNLGRVNHMIYEDSIDVNKNNGWRIKVQGGANDSIAYGVGESIIKPHKLDESNAIFTLNMNKDFKKRIRKVDVERQQMAMMLQNQNDEIIEKSEIERIQYEEDKKMMQGHQGATQESKPYNYGGDSLAIIRKIN